ncbi:hypothetical protein EG329_014356 [Mollisiaceae sp. DMI_Dod_QoI]|nr:hypothetical protein EG329_014356 [Helotiales sp. DMI_Dod_QoI]
MPFKDLLKKKDKVEEEDTTEEQPVFLFMRSDTNTQELIRPPTFSSHDAPEVPPYADPRNESKTSRLFRGRSRSGSVVSNTSISSRTSQKSNTKSTGSRRLSERLHLKKAEPTSESVPQDLPDIQLAAEEDGVDGVESQWELRATRLARKNEQSRSRPATPAGGSTTDLGSFNDMSISGRPGSAGWNETVVSTKQTDDNIQEAIRLHETGDLVTSTSMFGRLADPNGENNALSQVLYGLALRHGWGCQPDPAEAVKYLSAAASNAASVEDLALQAGMKKGGAAKGELVLAIFELANCFRHGWGVQVDKFAAKQVRHSEGLDRGEAMSISTDLLGQYYETAANLGDTDAMNEVGWCYLEGFGCKKDKPDHEAMKPSASQRTVWLAHAASPFDDCIWAAMGLSLTQQPHATEMHQTIHHSKLDEADETSPQYAAARYYRLAEQAGSKTLGNSWIWKEKYDPDKSSPKK